MSAVGDVLLWYGPMAGTLKHLSTSAEATLDPSEYPFGAVQSHLKGLVFGNLEGPLTRQPTLRFKPQWMKYYFKSPINEAVAALKLGGFRVMSVANNHSMDSGAAGLKESLQALHDGDILAVGAGKNEKAAQKALVVSSSQGGKVRFLAYCDVGPPGTFARKHRAGAARLEESVILKAVKREARHGDPVVVSLHWGIERKMDYPVADPEAWQRDLAHKVIDAGAVLILGHHTHAVSRFEEYKHGLIAYSLGNFLFSGARYPQRRLSVILHADLDAKGVHAWDLFPVRIDSEDHPFQPRPLPEAEGKAYLAALLTPPYRLYQFKP